MPWRHLRGHQRPQRKTKASTVEPSANSNTPVSPTIPAIKAWPPSPFQSPTRSSIPASRPGPNLRIEVLGAPNIGYETKGLPYTVSIASGAENSPLLAGVNLANILGAQSLYKVLPLAADVTAAAHRHREDRHQPTHAHRLDAQLRPQSKARIFYTSLGAPEDMEIADVRTLLINGVAWTLTK
jgi:hypothetical protein